MSRHRVTAGCRIIWNRCDDFLPPHLGPRITVTTKTRPSLSIPPSMPRRSVSLDLKACIPFLRYSAGYSVKEICGILGIRKSLVYQTLQYYAVHGVCYNPNTHKRGRHWKLTSIDINFIKSLISEHHTIYLDEIQEQLLTQRAQVSISTLIRTLF